MKAVFGIALGILLLLSVLAWHLQQPEDIGDRIPLVWVSDDNPVRQQQIALFNQTHPQYALRLDPTNTGMEKVIVQCLAGVGPDLFDCYDGFQLSAYVKSGVAWDVTDELVRRGIDPRERVWSAVLPNIVCEGRVYGCPTNAATDAVWYSKDIFDQTGTPYPTGPWTWAELVKLARRLTVREPDGRIVHFGLLCDWRQWQQFVLQCGGQIYSDAGTECVVDSPEAIRGVQFLQDLIYKYHVMPSPVEEASMSTSGGWGSGTITWFKGGRGAMAVGGRWWLCTVRGTEGLRMGAVECPHFGSRIFRGYGRATLINAQSPHRRAALDFLQYEAEQPYNDLVNEQADALAPVRAYCYTPEYLFNPRYPAEDYNAVWRDVMERGVPDQISPFVNGQRAKRVLDKQLDLVKNNTKTAAEALRAAAKAVNEEIEKNLDRDPRLRIRYHRLRREAGR